MAKGYFKNSTEVRRELGKIYREVKEEKLDIKKAECLKGILNSIQISISAENKEKEILETERLADEMRKFRGGK